MNKHHYPVHGAGLGLRRSIMGAIADQPPGQLNFLEVAPENWINVGGALGKQFSALAERYPVTAHGLSLSIGSPAPLDEAFLYKVKQFIQRHKIPSYSDHLSYCSDDGHLYDLMPIPFTEEAVFYVADRIRRAQDILEQRIAMENVSYYAAPGQEMQEIDFINAVISEADCDFLLDVNNIYVNSVNHQYEAIDFLKKLPAERVTYVHIAGHYTEAEDLIVDTHGADVVDTVWDLLHKTYEIFGVMPTLLERDFNIPPIAELLTEVDTIKKIQDKWNKQTSSQTQNG